jgi:hypothetical protein
MVPYTSTIRRKTARELTNFGKEKVTLKEVSEFLGVGINKIEKEFKELFKEYIADFKCGLTGGIKYVPNGIIKMYLRLSKYVNDGRYLFFGVNEYKTYLNKKKKTISIYLTEDTNNALSRREMQYVLEWWSKLPAYKKIQFTGGKNYGTGK